MLVDVEWGFPRQLFLITDGYPSQDEDEDKRLLEQINKVKQSGLLLCLDVFCCQRSGMMMTNDYSDYSNCLQRGTTNSRIIIPGLSSWIHLNYSPHRCW